MQSNYWSSREVEWRKIVIDIVEARILVICVVVAFVVVAGIAGILLPREYDASVIMVPANAAGGLSGQMGGGALAQYGGLAALAGVSLAGNSAKEEAVAVLQSELLTENFIRDNNLLPVLFSKQWDAQLRRWNTLDETRAPTLWKANRYFNRIRSVIEDTKTGLITLRIRWRDPLQASQWANELVARSNEYLRQRTIAETERNIKYLSAQAQETNIVQERVAIYSILEQEINQEMIARGRNEYALKIIDPAVPPELPSSLSVSSWVAIGAVTGFFVALSLLLARRTLWPSS